MNLGPLVEKQIVFVFKHPEVGTEFWALNPTQIGLWWALSYNYEITVHVKTAEEWANRPNTEKAQIGEGYVQREPKKKSWLGRLLRRK